MLGLRSPGPLTSRPPVSVEKPPPPPHPPDEPDVARSCDPEREAMLHAKRTTHDPASAERRDRRPMTPPHGAEPSRAHARERKVAPRRLAIAVPRPLSRED